jgi:hypothetical protein
MPSSFVAYIDESGDEVFTFREDGSGSSRWFVLSAAIVRRVDDLASVPALRSVREKLRWDSKKAFHFSAMKHEARLVLLHEMSRLSFQTVTIASYKPDIEDPDRSRSNKFFLYRDLTRLLVERVSWLCRDHLQPGEGDGTVELIFSDRASMSYDDIRGHIDGLRDRYWTGLSVDIHWPSIDTARLRAVAHSQLAGLQIADAVATSYYYAINLSRFGIADPSYLRLLRTHAYRREGACIGFGLKFLSSFEGLKRRMPHLSAAFEGW